MSIFDFLNRNKKNGKDNAVPEVTEAVNEEIPAEKVPPKEPYVTPRYTFGMHLYHRPGDDPTVYYIDEARGIRKMVVDNMGYIQDFPGIQKEDFWAKDVPERYLEPQIRFRTDFERRDGRIIMLWQVRPDGRYWEDDDGFGRTPDEETTLYAFLTEDGIFDGPFRIYRVGCHKYYQK